MNILRSNDVKRINKIVIRKALLDLRTATRKELMETTGISSSSIGSLIMEMVKENDILEESIDSSSGGRCPMRYVLNHEKYRIMCIVVDRSFAGVHILNSLAQEVYHHMYPLENDKEIMQKIKNLCEQYHVCSLNISTPGIIQGDNVIQDSVNGLLDVNYYRKLKELCGLPMIIDNDVKCMVQGYCADKESQDTSVSYIYMSAEGGLGSASMSDGTIIRGIDHLAGEIGLLEFGGKSMNNLLRGHPNEQETCDILARLISVLVCCINPSLIVLSGIKASYEEVLKQNVQAIVSDRFTVRFAMDENKDYHILKALWTKAMDDLMHEEEEIF